MLDITGSEFVEVEIRDDGQVFWVSTAEGMTVLRICQIKNIVVKDNRTKLTDIKCPTCKGTGLNHGNGSDCKECNGWGNVQVQIVGPCKPSWLSLGTVRGSPPQNPCWEVTDGP